VDQTEIQQPDAWRIPDEFLDGAQQEPIWVSTVFLCLDHWLGDETDPRPVLFETMVFGMPEGHELHEYNFNRRYHTAEEARKGHEEVVELVGKAIRATLTEATP
jgi:hypothetical protein